MSAHVDLQLLFDYGGVISTAPYPIVRRYSEHLVNVAVDRALASGTMAPNSLAVRNLGNIFLDCIRFTRARGLTPALQKLEAGQIRRRQFVREAEEEFDIFMKYMTCVDEKALCEITSLKSPKEVAHMRKKLSLLQHPGYGDALRSVYDPENYLCLLEKTPLRRNVLNMLHFLRMKSHQEVKIGIVANTWEIEGEYVANTHALERSGTPVFVSGSCPREYQEQTEHFKGRSFDINGLFDVVVQSHVMHRRKPSPDLLHAAIEAMTGANLVGVTDVNEIRNKMRNIRLFLFEDRMENVNAGAKLPGTPFTKCFHVQNGAGDVYKFVVAALNEAGRIDSRWSKLREELEKTISPLFQSVRTESWIKLEVTNEDGNLLFLPHPHDSALETWNAGLTSKEKTILLSYLTERLPQYFPCNTDKENKLPLDVAPSIATSCGPIAFEKFRSRILSDAYRVSLRTGSFIIRFEPRGGDMTRAESLIVAGGDRQLVRAASTLADSGVKDTIIKRSYTIARFLSRNSKIPVAHYLLYGANVASVGREFCVSRYVDGSVIRSLRDLVRQRVSRPFSQSRVLSTQSLRPRLFIEVALDLLVKIHHAPIPPTMQARAKQLSEGPIHPVHGLILHWQNHMRRAVERSKNQKENFDAPLSLKHLEKLLCDIFAPNSKNNNDKDNKEAPKATASNNDLRASAVPRPKKITLVHANFGLSGIMFSHRSLEGQPKYPPRVVQLMNTHSVTVGDPFLDIARMSLLPLLPLPYGISNLPESRRELFPTADEIVESYLAKVANIDPTDSIINHSLSNDEVKRRFAVYQSAQCYRQAMQLGYGLQFAKGLEASEVARRRDVIDEIATVAVKLLGSTVPTAAEAAAAAKSSQAKL